MKGFGTPETTGVGLTGVGLTGLWDDWVDIWLDLWLDLIRHTAVTEDVLDPLLKCFVIGRQRGGGVLAVIADRVLRFKDSHGPSQHRHQGHGVGCGSRAHRHHFGLGKHDRQEVGDLTALEFLAVLLCGAEGAAGLEAFRASVLDADHAAKVCLASCARRKFAEEFLQLDRKQFQVLRFVGIIPIRLGVLFLFPPLEASIQSCR